MERHLLKVVRALRGHRNFTCTCRYLSASSKTGAQNISTDGETTKTHFGYQTVTEAEKEARVYKVFENVAEKYDVMNDAMSIGIHRLWKDYFMEKLSPTPGTTLLDVAGGTGDIAFRFLQYTQNQEKEDENEAEFDFDKNIFMEDSEENTSFDWKLTEESSVTVCDINQAMLNVGKTRARELGYTENISWLKGNAENLPVADSSFDCYTVAFGIRNMTHIDKVLCEAYRILKPGGRFMCLEFSEVNSAILKRFYDEYSFQVIPVVGKVVAGDWDSYQYLVESIRKFPSQEDFARMIQSAGFKAVSYENLSLGIAAIHSGFKL